MYLGVDGRSPWRKLYFFNTTSDNIAACENCENNNIKAPPETKWIIIAVCWDLALFFLKSYPVRESWSSLKTQWTWLLLISRAVTFLERDQRDTDQKTGGHFTSCTNIIQPSRMNEARCKSLVVNKNKYWLQSLQTSEIIKTIFQWCLPKTYAKFKVQNILNFLFHVLIFV